MSRLPSQLRNRYFAFRHGQSEANIAGLIVSYPLNGTDKYPLSPAGRAQVRDTADAADFDMSTVILSSNFARAKGTAEIAANSWGVTRIRFDQRLGERNFGEFELGSDRAYDTVWAQDRSNDNNLDGVETVEHVQQRAVDLVLAMELEYERRNIVFVSHADVLQILQAAFSGVDASKHRSLPALELAELRELT